MGRESDKITKDRVAQYKKKLSALESAASKRDDWLNRIYHYATPTLYNLKYDSGTNRSNLPDDIYDSEMVQGAFEFANLFFTYLSNPASNWLKTIVLDDVLDQPGVKDALEQIDKKVASVLALSNFYSAIHEAYYSLIAGNCVVYRERDEKDIVRYYNLPLTECYYEYDKKKRVNSMYRKVHKTPLEVMEEFPKTVHKKVVNDAKQSNQIVYVNCLHVVRPRWQRDVTKKDVKNKAYESLWIDVDNGVILSESGYDKFPYFVGHYLRDPQQPYSYGPAHLCFYDAKSLNQIMLSQLRRAAKEADPPVSLPHDGYVLPYLQDPSSVNYRLTDDPKDKAEYMMPPPASVAVNQTIEDMRGKIRRAFFVDLYRSVMDSTKRMTTVEVEQLIADRAPMLGPAIWNITTDFISLIIEDLIEILIETKVIYDLPDELSGGKIVFKYMSPLARSQQVTEYQSIQAFLQYMAGAVQFNQDVVDIPDWDKYTRITADATGVPQEIIREEPEVKKIRQEKQEALARAQQKQEIVEGAGAMKDITQADKNAAQAQQGG